MAGQVNPAEARLLEENAALKQRVNQLEQRVQQGFHDSSAVQLVIDPANGRIVDANQAAARFYGYSREELLELRITELNRLPAELVEQEMEAARAQSRSYFEFKHRLSSGEVRDVQVYSGPVQFGDRQLLSSIICDITERTQLAEQLAHSQRMDALGRLAGGVAHDINNLLTALDMLASLIRGDIARVRPVEPHLAELESLTGRGAALTQQLLAFCRRQMLEPQLLDLNRIVEHVEGLLTRLMRSDVRLVLRLAPSPACVVADSTRLEQVLLNLVLNARDAMPRGGEIQIEVSTQSLSAEERAELGVEWTESVRLSVRDQGVGMDAETLRHAFEPFFTTKPAGEGTGLGLSTAYGIVEQSGGRIRAESTVGVGTLFQVWFPQALEPGLLLEEPSAVEGLSAGTESLLLVDDDADVRTTLAAVLRSAGYQVSEASGASEALELLAKAERPFALLITDVVMPQMSGPELVQRARVRTSGLRVLYTSGFLDLPNVGLGLKGVGETLLQKPFTAARLLTKVRQVLDVP